MTEFTANRDRGCIRDFPKAVSAKLLAVLVGTGAGDMALAQAMDRFPEILQAELDDVIDLVEYRANQWGEEVVSEAVQEAIAKHQAEHGLIVDVSHAIANSRS